jgi:iron-sulfur cluster assembly protein
MAIDTNQIASKTQNTDLITMSDSAVSHLRELISQQENPSPNLGLRVFVYPGGCSGMSYGMAFEDQPADDDMTIEVQGVKLYVDE